MQQHTMGKFKPAITEAKWHVQWNLSFTTPLAPIISAFNDKYGWFQY